MEGGYDPDCRRCMDWSGYEAGRYDESVQLIRKLTALRQSYAWADAETVITAQSETLIVKRRLNEIELSLYINLSDQDAAVDGRIVRAHSHLLL